MTHPLYDELTGLTESEPDNEASYRIDTYPDDPQDNSREFDFDDDGACAPVSGDGDYEYPESEYDAFGNDPMDFGGCTHLNSPDDEVPF